MRRRGQPSDSRLLLTSSLWLRAPLLLRAPAVLLAVALSAAVAAVAACSGVLFLASATTGSLHNSASLECPEQSQPAISNSRTSTEEPSDQQSPGAVRRMAPVVSDLLAGRGLGGPDLVQVSPVALPQQPDPNRSAATLLARAGARSHVTVISSVGGAGALVPRSFATATGVRAGQWLRAGGGGLRVAGIYRDLAPSAFVPLFALDRYWCTWTPLIVPTPFNRPPPLFITDAASLQSVSTTIDATWYVPGSVNGFSVAQVQARLDASSAALSELVGPTSSAYRQVTDLPYLIAKAHRVRAGLRGPVIPIDVAGIAVAMVLVAGAGQYWALRRRTEIRLLTSRGVAPAALGLKAVLELAPAMLGGTVLGWLAAIGLVKALGPSTRWDAGAATGAFELAVASLVAISVVVAGMGTYAAVGVAPRRGRRWAWRSPWELFLLAAAGLTYGGARRGGAAHVVKATVQISPSVFACALLGLAGAIALVTRATNALLRPCARAGRNLPAAGYLALQRIAGTPAVALGVIVGTALPCGVLLYSSALVGATGENVRAKYETNVGADYAFGTLAEPGSTPELHGHGTVVSVFQNDAATATETGLAIQVLGVDPTTFSRFAHQGSTVRALVTRLGSSGSGPTAALLVNAPASVAPSSLHLRDSSVAIRVIARRASFPGLRDGLEPMVVVDRDALAHVDRMAERVEELWTTKSQLPAALAALRSGGVDANYQISTTTFLDNSGLRPVTWIFNYLRSLAVLTGLVALTGLTLALATRTRHQALAYHLARRMGLGRGQHLRSLAVELSILVAVGCTIGGAVAAAAVALGYRLIDLYRDLPPPPTYPVPIATAAGIAIAAVAVVAAGVLCLQTLYDRSNPNTLLRQD